MEASGFQCSSVQDKMTVDSWDCATAKRQNVKRETVTDCLTVHQLSTLHCDTCAQFWPYFSHAIWLWIDFVFLFLLLINFPVPDCDYCDFVMCTYIPWRLTWHFRSGSAQDSLSTCVNNTDLIQKTNKLRMNEWQSQEQATHAARAFSSSTIMMMRRPFLSLSITVIFVHSGFAPLTLWLTLSHLYYSALPCRQPVDHVWIWSWSSSKSKWCSWCPIKRSWLGWSWGIKWCCVWCCVRWNESFVGPKQS